MNSFKHSMVLFLSSAALLFGALVPSLASAQVYYPYTDYNYYNTNCASGTGYYWNQNCNNQGTLTVYVQVNNQYGGYHSPSEFTIYVSGANASQQYFQGSQNGTTIRLNGTYAVSIYNNAMGYTPSYSGSCSGTISVNDTRVCYVTLTNSNYNYPPQYQPYYPNYQYQQPVTIVSKYVPTLPNTGFEPVSSASIAFALVLLLAFGALVYPYVRKTLASIFE